MSAPGPFVDRDLFVGLLALQLGFVGRDALIAAVSAAALDKARPLSDILRDQAHLSAERLRLLTNLAEELLKEHGDDPQRCLAALPLADQSIVQELQSIVDPGRKPSLTATAVYQSGPHAAAGSIRPPSPKGRYEIVRFHAQGGLGEVYVAEDQELGRQVALKEIQARFADDPDNRARFLLEAEVTGGLEHPGVVPVYGLGAYADGRPFYAMRFIKGDNLQQALRQFHRKAHPLRRASFEGVEFRQLLRRFVDVCNAIAYAHSRGVLHRDLKPGNVMLGKYGETLVVDWGLAKVVGRATAGEAVVVADETTLRPRYSGETTVLTEGQTLGTPAYMSPEQAAGRLDQLGPPTDIYSLGTTLYELLTGLVPFSRKGIDAVQHGLFPPPRQVCPAVPLALEAICLKAMALKPEDRHPSALALAADVEHWLADEPVSAWREPAGVRAWRWARRHRTLMAGAAALLLTTAIGLAVGFVLVSREQAATARERDEKEQARQDAVASEQQAVAARDAEAVARKRTRRALNTLTDDVVERLFARQVQLGEAERRFLRQVQEFYTEFAAAGGESPEDRASRADGAYRVALLRQRLGELAEAETSYRDAIAAYAALAADFPAEALHRAHLSDCQNSLGTLLHMTGRAREAEAAIRAALLLREKLVADFPTDRAFRSVVASGHNNLGVLLHDSGRLADAENEYRVALTMRVQLTADFPEVAEYAKDLAASQLNLGNVYRETGRLPEAEATYRASLAACEKLATDFPANPEYRIDVANRHNNLGALLRVTRRPVEAEAAFRAAVGVYVQLTADFPAVPAYRDVLARCHNNLGNLLADTGRPDEAEDAYSAALGVGTRLASDFPTVADYANLTAGTLVNLAHVARQRKDYIQARRWLDLAQPYHRSALEAKPNNRDYRVSYGNNLSTLAPTLASLGDHAAAAARAEELIALDIDPDDDHYDAACCLARCVPLAENDPDLDADKRRALAESYGRRAVALLRQAFIAEFPGLTLMSKDSDLDPIRGRADFADLLWDLAGGASAP